MNIPKIIHHIAPKDKSRWHPIWDRCYPTWKQHFPDFEHRLWNDDELDEIVKNQLPEYHVLFNELPVHMMKIDFMKFVLLYVYGGIYADMDMFCYKNFYHELDGDLHLLEACYGNEPIENAMIVSSRENKFILQCMNLCKQRFYKREKLKYISCQGGFTENEQQLILKTTGPHLVSDVFKEFKKDKIKTLSGIHYNNHGLSYHSEYRTKHMLTGMWGKEIIDVTIINNKKDSLWKHYLEDVRQFIDLKNISIDNFDFYKDYTNGGMMKSFIIDMEKSNIDNSNIINYS